MEILDYQMQHVLKGWIRELPFNQQEQLKNILLCGNAVAKHPARMPGVFVLCSSHDDESEAKFFGQTSCKNPFCCPVCSAKMMERYRSKIASALDMLKPDYFAFMMTFTVPHLSFMLCRETTDILYDTWKYFHLKNFTKGSFHAYQRFNAEVPVDYWVRVCEYTYGDNGWHPHFHCIFWTKRGNEDKILKWQEELNAFWTQSAKRVTLKYWKANNLHANEDQEKLCDRLYSKASTKYPALKISVDKKTGKVLESLSSDYLTGWGGDRELTGNIRKEASHEDHFTPYQILTKAKDDPKFKEIYLDFCLSVTRKPVHHRVNFSKNGLTEMIKEYLKTHDSKSVVYQKKRLWKVIEFFDEKQWSEICQIDTILPVKSNILYLAAKAPELLSDYLSSLEELGYRRRRALSIYYEKIFQQAKEVEGVFNVA